MRSVVHIFTKPFAYDEGPKQCNEAYTRKPVLVKWIHNPLRRMAGDCTGELKTHQVQANFVESLRRRPQVQWRSRNLVHQRNCESVNRHVHRFQVVLTGIAGFHAHGCEIFRRIARKFLMIDFATNWTENPPELPFRRTKGTDQKALAAVTFRMENRDLRP